MRALREPLDRETFLPVWPVDEGHDRAITGIFIRRDCGNDCGVGILGCLARISRMVGLDAFPLKRRLAKGYSSLY